MMRIILFLLIGFYSSMALALDYVGEVMVGDIPPEQVSSYVDSFAKIELLSLWFTEQDSTKDLKQIIKEKAWPDVELKKQLEPLFDRVNFKKNQAHPEKLSTWIIEVEADINDLAVYNWLNEIIEGYSKNSLILIYRGDYSSFPWEELQMTELEFNLALINPWLVHLKSLELTGSPKIISCLNECVNRYDEWKSSEKSVDLLFKDSVVVDLKMNALFEPQRNMTHEIRITTSGGLVMVRGQNQQMIYFKDISSQTKTINNKNKKDFNSQLATFIYKQPLLYFSELKKHYSTIYAPAIFQLKLEKFKSLNEVMRVRDHIKSKILKNRGDIALESFSRESARLKISTLDEEKNIQDMISNASELKSMIGRECSLSKVDNVTVLSCP